MRQNAALRGMGEQAAIAAHSAKVANMGASLAGSTALLQQLESPCAVSLRMSARR